MDMKKSSGTYASGTLLQRRKDLRQGVSLAVRRRNPRICEPRVGGERLEQLDYGLEVRHSLRKRVNSSRVGVRFIMVL